MKPYLGDFSHFIDNVDETLQKYLPHLDPMTTHQAARFILDELLSLPLEHRMAAMGMEQAKHFSTRRTNGTEEPMWRPVFRCDVCDGQGYIRKPDPEHSGTTKAMHCEPCCGTGRFF